ncbi:MAG TPA: T9SS type A sorting domain-containing protein [Bacteroidetes bacterium]|nr:T9SS type A sorting domain-containing protein [Bacteroidota bacterium]
MDNNYSSEFCEGDSTVLFADCNVNFVWSTGSNDDKIKVYEEGWIFLVATNNDGCQAKDSIYITVHNSPVISGIQGSLNPNANTTNTYSIENPNPNSIYIWEISNGVLKTGQNTPQVEIEWSGNDKGKICVFETNKYNCSSENYCVNVDIITATYEIENQSVIIYPNPVSDHLFIYSKDKLQLSRITIVNYFGEKIMSKKLILKHKNSINITDIPSGVYMIYIESNAKKIMKKIIKI